MISTFPKTIEIDFLSIDTEGFDYDILKSNDWVKYRPRVIVVENIVYSKNIYFSEIKEFLETVGYNFFCNSPANAFFIENNYVRDRFYT